MDIRLYNRAVETINITEVADKQLSQIIAANQRTRSTRYYRSNSKNNIKLLHPTWIVLI